ncbi:hypothetical protein [Frankia sp. CiP1_Cm_nod1]|uniref:hypothetical protein n=1 Tax=Frankia sp. CiP1_Cm_nod1 TaxID=2897160 RepID=UPI0020257E05
METVEFLAWYAESLHRTPGVLHLLDYRRPVGTAGHHDAEVGAVDKGLRAHFAWCRRHQEP